MDKSLLNLIRQAFVSESPVDVIIHERTLATELIESEKDGDPFALYDFLPRSYRGKNLVLTRHLIYIFRNIALFFIAICYALYDLLHRVFTGKWKSKPLDDKVKERRIPDKEWIKKLHPEKWRGIQSSSGLNTILLSVTLIVMAITLVWGLHFLIKEVMLPENNCRVNHYGIVTFDQGCLEEQHFFLLNAATFWTPTGIAISKGDKVYITASGSMYSDIDNMVESASSNKKLLYPRSKFNKKYEKRDQDADYCVYGRYAGDNKKKKNKPVFGSLLYQICDEVQGPKPYNDCNDSLAVKQINFAKNKNSTFRDKRFHFTSHQSGILYFSFNDILLDDPMIDTIIENKERSTEIYNDLLKMAPLHHREGSWLKDNVDSLVWFEDNFGEALVNVRVEKNVWASQLSFHKKLLVALYRRIGVFYSKTKNGFPIDFLHSGVLIVILLVLLWFGLDFFVSKRLKKPGEVPSGVTPSQNG